MTIAALAALIGFHIPAGDGRVTLSEWGRQAHIIYARIQNYDVAGWHDEDDDGHWPITNAVDCTFCTPRTALCSMLKGTGYRMPLEAIWPPTYTVIPVYVRASSVIGPDNACAEPPLTVNTVFNFNIPAEELSRTLRDMDRITQFLFYGILAMQETSISAPPLVGRFTIVQAICKLMQEFDPHEKAQMVAYDVFGFSVPQIVGELHSENTKFVSGDTELDYPDSKCMQKTTDQLNTPNVKFTVIDPSTSTAKIDPLESLPSVTVKSLMKAKALQSHPKPVPKPTPLEDAPLQQCECAQTPEGIPLGPWCLDAKNELHHIPACRRPPQDTAHTAQ